jgi:hypothetical protein
MGIFNFDVEVKAAENDDSIKSLLLSDDWKLLQIKGLVATIKEFGIHYFIF